MKRLDFLFGFFLTASILFCSQSCKKDDDNNVVNTTHNFVSFTDSRDGNVYKTIQIGSQVWMAENLNYATDTGSWAYNDSSKYADKLGRLYNWWTACEVCPDGWHLPSDEEWTELTDFWGGTDVAGGMFKDIGNAYWDAPNSGATNESGFSALGSGYYFSNDVFDGLNTNSIFWTSTAYQNNAACYTSLSYENINVKQDYWNKYFGFSVRCVKDN